MLTLDDLSQTMLELAARQYIADPERHWNMLPGFMEHGHKLPDTLRAEVNAAAYGWATGVMKECETAKVN